MCGDCFLLGGEFFILGTTFFAATGVKVVREDNYE